MKNILQGFSIFRRAVAPRFTRTCSTVSQQREQPGSDLLGEVHRLKDEGKYYEALEKLETLDVPLACKIIPRIRGEILEAKLISEGKIDLSNFMQEFMP